MLHIICINDVVNMKRIRVRTMVFNVTFNNIPVILWQSILLVEEIGVPNKINVCLYIIKISLIYRYFTIYPSLCSKL
jgi:hypothetical protein